MTTAARSPIAEIYDALRAHNAGWSVDVGQPSGPGWIAGTDLREASTGSFNELLRRIGERSKTVDRRTIAALFALRYGWASAMAIAPYLRYGCVPDISLENVSLKFRESTFFERTAIHEPCGFMAAASPGAVHSAITPVKDDAALLRSLRSQLTAQAAAVVVALQDWSGFAPKGTWGMLTSSWAAQFTGLFEGGDQREMLPILERFFAGDDVVTQMQPRLHAVTCQDVTHLYQRRASCCRWYLLPQGELCASCPLVSHDDRLARNRAWMQSQLERQGEKRGHT